MSTDKPTVTFAVFAFNQERYIREAVQSAFEQTYSPLEIILSDDCSTDRTFEIMYEMARTYEGPHKVRARQSAQNVGTLTHVLEVADEAEGEYIVVAAGDDISLPQRCDATINYMLNSGSDITSAACIEFEDDILDKTSVRKAVRRIREFFLNGRPWAEQIHGATAAYRVSFLRSIPKPKGKVLLEDIALRIIAFWVDAKISNIDEIVAYYRVHSENIGPKSGRVQENVRNMESEFCVHNTRIMSMLKYLQEVYRIGLPESNGGLKSPFAINIQALKRAELLSRWLTLPPVDQIRLMVLSVSSSSPRRDFMRALGPLVYFSAMRMFYRRAG